MTFQFRPARREQAPLLIGVAGPSGSGKTASALKLARGIVGGDEGIYLVDTEGSRAKHYACAAGEEPGPFRFRFEHLDFTAPFSPDRYLEAIAAATASGARVVIVDSMSHCHEGAGGLLDAHEQELERMAGSDLNKRERVKFTAWIKPKAANGRLVNAILQMRCHMIFTLRAKDKIAIVKGRDGKTEPVQVGWTPICTDRFEYEMTTMLMLPPGAQGVPDLSLEATKIHAHHKAFFPPGEPISEAAGAALAAWARGGASAPVSAPVEMDFEERAQRHALVTEIRVLADERGWTARQRIEAWKEFCGRQTSIRVDLGKLQRLREYVLHAPRPVEVAGPPDDPEANDEPGSRG